MLENKIQTAEGGDGGEGEGMLYITTIAKRSIMRAYCTTYLPKCLRIK
jgi:hypothetical protein